MARIRLNCGRHEIRRAARAVTSGRRGRVAAWFGGAGVAALAARVPQWIATDWPFTRPRYIGRDVSWADWLALPDVDPPGGG